MVQGVLKEFCQNTSIHGLSSIVEAKSSLIKRIAWFVIFVISISYAGIQLKGNVDSKLTLLIIKIRNILRKQLKVGCSFPRSDFRMKVKQHFKDFFKIHPLRPLKNPPYQIGLNKVAASSTAISQNRF